MEWLWLAGALGVIIASRNQGSSRKVTFEVTTRVPLPVGEQVFVTGDDEALGNWRADGFPLTRVDDNAWSGTVPLPKGRPVEYKITRGSWETEEVMEDGSTPGNMRLESGLDKTVRHAVEKWKDRAQDPSPQITGNYRIHEGFHSRYLRFDRRVIVWLPPSYDVDVGRRYPVLYMHDGQQVFDPTTSTWGQDWQVDEWCSKLIGEDRLQEIIVVAAYSTEDRYVEYNPSLAGPQYARFVIEELKPFIDARYRTLGDREHTAVAGASMGATISFYLAWTRPDVFFGTACLSPAFRFRNDQSVLDMVRRTKDHPPIKVFLYCGEGDPTEQELAAGMQEMDDLLKYAGFSPGRDLLMAEDPAGTHCEASWARHTDQWLLFLFGR